MFTIAVTGQMFPNNENVFGALLHVLPFAFE